MNQRLVDSVAQIITAMSDEERRALSEKVGMDNLLTPRTPSSEEIKSFRVAEIAQQIADYESKYTPKQPAPLATATTEGATHASADLSANQKSLSSFFELASSLDIEGPPDFSSRIDDYLNEDALSTHD